VPFGFPIRPDNHSGALRISRFPNEVLAYVHGVSDRAGSERISRLRCARCGLRLLL